MNIVCNIDNGYVKYCIVMLTSLFVNNPEETFHIHIIAGELSEEARHQLTDIVERKYKQQLSLYLVGEEVLASCPIDHENYISTYYRGFITDILPRGERPPVNYLFRLNNLSMQFQGWLGLKNVYRKTKVV